MLLRLADVILTTLYSYYSFIVMIVNISISSMFSIFINSMSISNFLDDSIVGLLLTMRGCVVTLTMTHC